MTLGPYIPLLVIGLKTFVLPLRNRDSSPFVDELSWPPVLPKDFVIRTCPRDFLRMVCDHSFRLEHHASAVDNIVDKIADEHKELIMQYRTDGLLKHAIDSSPEGRNEDTSSSFVDAWIVQRSNGFQHLHAFRGGIATLFPETCTVESDISVLRWEKDNFRKSLSDFGLKAILQAKQFLAIPQLQ